MIFSYLNHKDIWPKYCAVYEAIYDHMGDFDTWYSTQQDAGTTIPSLLKEWKEYNRLVLDSMVRRARDTETWMYNNKDCGVFGCFLTPQLVRMWAYNHYRNYFNFKIANTCKNMDKSTV
ncbi:hypothetical protein BFJ69_g5478 [Fusarium oxysporum]|uniref:Uncharacterized protein n=1 Tax=Fusarium oxysporum TaxID=5507 RepID=A0A420NDT9_FUSOX|nr:hypothetical protein BFJ69_g5478 [Fusarium oxysporum]